MSSTEPSGTFDDGSEEDEYASDANCRWTIAPNNASWVRLSFNDFDISDEDCVNVYKGTNNNDLTLVGSYNNSNYPPTAITNANGNMIRVDLLTDCYIQKAGFSAEWTSNGNDDITSVSDHASLDFETFPNPASTTVGIIVSKEFNDGNVRITDMTGRIVLEQKLVSDDDITTLSLQNLTSGIYTITLYNQKEISSKKLIIKK